MAPAPPQVFDHIMPDQYARLMKMASAAGFNLAGNSGTASQFGVEICWNYSPDTLELSIQCLSAPFFLSAEAVDAKIKGLVEGAVA